MFDYSITDYIAFYNLYGTPDLISEDFSVRRNRVAWYSVNNWQPLTYSKYFNKKLRKYKQ